MTGPRKRVLCAPPKPTESVYFIYSAGKMKIGYTNSSIRYRLSNLSTGSADRLTLVCLFGGTKHDEHMLHKFFEEERLQGEWFRISHRMKEFLADVDARAAGCDIKKWFPDWPTSIERLEAADEAYQASKHFIAPSI